MILIRPSRDADIDAITVIYRDHVLHGSGTFETEPPGAADIAARRADVLGKGLPWLVAQQEEVNGNGAVVGFAYCQWFKPRPAYRFSAEDSIYVARDAVGRGIGRMLLDALISDAEHAGVRSLIAVIGDSANAASIGVHRAAGFAHVGVLASCGFKFGRWLDVVLMQRPLGAGDTTLPD